MSKAPGYFIKNKLGKSPQKLIKLGGRGVAGQVLYLKVENVRVVILEVEERV